MISFLIISTLSLALLLVVYQLVLQRENMHVFNRFYLLFAILFSLTIPLIQIETEPGTILLPGFTHMVEAVGQAPAHGQLPPPAARTNLLPLLYLFLYLAGMLLMLSRFIRNLVQIRLALVKNASLPLGAARLVLIDKPLMPHSFLHFIFISRSDYENNVIEEELLQHELAHVRQRHTIDILLVELLKIIFWFNPLLYLYGRAIKLNHEFLADQSVLRSNNDVTCYQEILLNKIFMNKASGLASHVHYSLTKKRLIMMTKNTSFLRALALKMTATLLFIALFLVFCVKALAQDKPPKVVAWSKIKNQDSLRRVKDLYYGNTPGAIYLIRRKGAVDVSKRYQDMTQEEKDAMLPPPLPPEKRVPTEWQMKEWEYASKYGVWIDNKRVSNEELRKYKPGDFGHYFISRLHKNTINYGKHTYQLDLTTVAAFEKWRKQSLKILGLDENK